MWRASQVACSSYGQRQVPTLTNEPALWADSAPPYRGAYIRALPPRDPPLLQLAQSTLHRRTAASPRMVRHLVLQLNNAGLGLLDHLRVVAAAQATVAGHHHDSHVLGLGNGQESWG